MLARNIAPLLHARLENYPAAVLVGPRQCGKTTIAQSISGRYFDLEQDSDRLRLDLEWMEVARRNDLVILDEAQAWPEVFSRLRGVIDADRRRNGRFLLLGSVSPALMTQVSESLAGRLSVVELTPLLTSEVEGEEERRRLWLCGGFPDGGVLRGTGFPQWQRDYLNLLAQRDLPNLGMTAPPQATIRLLRMLAAGHGQEWNASQIGKSLALSYHTVNKYLDYLEGTFLIRRLPAYHANLRKRLVKRPKVYWRDSGLLHSLLNVPDRESLLHQPWVGASWEGFVIDQALGALHCTGASVDAYHFRTSDRREIDLLVQVNSELWALEIKLTTHPGPDDLARLDANADLVGADRRFLVSQHNAFMENGPRILCNLEGLVGYIGRSGMGFHGGSGSKDGNRDSDQMV